MDQSSDFLRTHQQYMAVNGFWAEEYREMIFTAIELMYKTEILREWGVADIVTNGDKILIRWSKRIIPLTDQQLKEEYGR